MRKPLILDAPDKTKEDTFMQKQNNKNNGVKMLATCIGEFAGGVRTAYDERLDNKAKAERLAQEFERMRRAVNCYKFVCVEMAEVFSVIEKAVDCIERTQPEEIRLPFNPAHFVDGETYFYYKLNKAYDREETPMQTILDTINKVCLDRYKQGFSPFLTPRECKIEKCIGHYIVSVGQATQLPNMPLKNKGLGHHVGLFHYVEGSDYAYISSKQPQYFTYGRVFQLLDCGYWVNVRLDYDGYITTSSGERYLSKNLHGCYARISEADL
ncbi:MAG: hypothetical protein N3I35_04845 [Clostridia bacterium]|nr:hypothetical protein [Clostridia bacterium]